jgi:hypothetical protein
MKSSDLIIIGAAGIAVYYLWQKVVNRTMTGTTKEITTQSGAAFPNGWRYFDDGTAINPQGQYFFDGRLVYSPPK